MSAVLAVVVVMALVCAALVWALNRMGAAHDALIGLPPARRQTPWMKPFNEGGALSGQAGLRMLDKVLIGAVVLAGLAFEAWFFFLAGSSIGSGSANCDLAPRANGGTISIRSPLQNRPGLYQLAGRRFGSRPMCW